MSGMEIERKFLVKNDAYRRQAHASSHIRQGYICSGGGRTVRVRVRDDEAFLTIKGPSLDGGLSRYEFEKAITPDEALHLMLLCEPGIIDKTRYLIDAGEYTFEVDVFHGDNEGLIIAEIELPDEEAAYERPEWLGQEVTGDNRYYNAMLSVHPYQSWKNR